MTETVISIKNLTKSFDKVNALTEFTADVQAGEIIAVLGLNGAGKTTLLETLFGFSLPDSGTTKLFGHETRVLTDQNVKKRIGFVPQREEVLQSMRVDQYLNLVGTFYTDWDNELVGRLCNEWQLPTTKRIRKLSTGQRQKVAIISAIGFRPDLLVLDEPVASLDPKARRQFLREIIKLSESNRCTILFSTHIVGDVERIADRLWLLKEGRLFLDAAIDDIKEKTVRIQVQSETLSEELLGGLSVINMRNESLGELPKISAAFRGGEISYSKVRAITRVAQTGNEDYLLMIARHGTAHHVETLVSGYRRAERLNDDGVAEQQFNNRSLSYHWDDDGSLVFKGRLPGEVAAVLLKALESSLDNTGHQKDATEDGWEPIAARRADALAEMAESYLETGPAESSTADRYQVMLHVTAVTPQEENCYIENGPHVTAVTSRRICCDASVSTLVENGDGEPLSIGRKSRVIPAAMRRALKARDRNCRFPGCTHQHSIDGHHIKHWADGGETCLDNLVQLCRFHHHLVHEGGFGCEKDLQGRVVFTNVQGDPIENNGYRPSSVKDDVVIHLKDKLEDRHIHAQTCVTKWQGERMDRGMAVANLQTSSPARV